MHLPAAFSGLFTVSNKHDIWCVPILDSIYNNIRTSADTFPEGNIEPCQTAMMDIICENI